MTFISSREVIGTDGPLITLYQNCSNYLNYFIWLKNMAPRGHDQFFLC